MTRPTPDLPLFGRLLTFVPLLLLLPGCPTDDSGDGTPTGDDTSSPTPRPLPDDVFQALENIPGLTLEEGITSAPGYRLFYLTYSQPADHDHPEGAWFEQRLTLMHRDWDAPTVLHTGGYFVSESDYRCELTQLLNANQISVEHRFFEPSRPDPADWSTLTIEQSAADFHRIAEAFKPLYTGAWIGTGASKGGMTSVYHRRFYPDDLDATVPYVAPLSFGGNDPRYLDFLEQVGDAQCRQKLSDFQVIALSRREAMIDYMHTAAASWGTSFDFLGYDKALEHAVLELPFAFWQYYGDWLCPSIPGESSSDEQVAGFVDYVSWFYAYSDESVSDYEPYYYQASVQLGYPAISEEGLSDLLEYPGTDIAETYVSFEIDTPFDTQAMLEVDEWVKTQGETLMFIYGEYDPWSAGAFELGEAGDSYIFWVPEGNHGSNISGLSDPDRTLALETLERWTGVAAQRSLKVTKDPYAVRERPTHLSP